jgi:hypothetical protein
VLSCISQSGAALKRNGVIEWDAPGHGNEGVRRDESTLARRRESSEFYGQFGVL